MSKIHKVPFPFFPYICTVIPKNNQTTKQNMTDPTGNTRFEAIQQKIDQQATDIRQANEAEREKEQKELLASKRNHSKTHQLINKITHQLKKLKN